MQGIILSHLVGRAFRHTKLMGFNCRYFLLCVNYFFYGETVADYFATFVQREEQLQFLIRYHRFISFALYLAGKLKSVFVDLCSCFPHVSLPRLFKCICVFFSVAFCSRLSLHYFSCIKPFFSIVGLSNIYSLVVIKTNIIIAFHVPETFLFHL